jgi:hypothetical protein
MPLAHKSMNIERDFQFIFKNRKKQKSENVTNSNRNFGGGLTNLSLCDEKIRLVTNRSEEPKGVETESQ